MFYLPVLSLLGLGHSFVATGPHKWRLNGVSSLQAIDVSSLPVDPSAFASVPNADSMIGDSVSDLQTLPLLLAGAFYLAYERRPQGTCNKELVDIRKSSVPNAGLGVYASKTIPSGTQIGTFPGSVVNLDACLASKKDDEARQRCKAYLWALSSDSVLDATTEDGTLELETKYLFGLFTSDNTMARVNEPPPGGDCNVYTRVNGALVEIIAERDIFANEVRRPKCEPFFSNSRNKVIFIFQLVGSILIHLYSTQELFMDYGSTFDRTDYSEQEKENERLAKDYQREKREAEKL